MFSWVKVSLAAAAILNHSDSTGDEGVFGGKESDKQEDNAVFTSVCSSLSVNIPAVFTSSS